MYNQREDAAPEGAAPVSDDPMPEVDKIPPKGITETVCPGFNSGRCATCDCPWTTEQPAMVAPRGAALVGGVYGGGRCHAGMNPDGVLPWQVPHPDDLLELKRRHAEREALRMMKRATGCEESAGEKRRRSVGILRWAEDKLAAAVNGERDERTKDVIYFLGKFVNDGHLTPNEVRQAILSASESNGHRGGNKSVQQIERDIDRGLDKAARDGITVEWERLP